MDDQDLETIKMFTEESKEHLADIEGDLLAIEEGGADIDEELVNKIFRAVHSIKGSAGFMGFDNVKALSHELESVMGMIRSGDMVPNSEIINILLDASDKLRELIDNIDQSNDMDISPHVTALAGIAGGAVVSPPEKIPETPEEIQPQPRVSEEPAVTAPPRAPAEESLLSPGVPMFVPQSSIEISLPDNQVSFWTEKAVIDDALQSGNYIYLIEYDLLSDVQQRHKELGQILEDIKNSGDILDIYINMAELGTLEDTTLADKFPLVILFASIIDPAIISSLFEINDRLIHSVTDDLKARLSGDGDRERPQPPLVESEPRKEEETFEPMSIVSSEEIEPFLPPPSPNLADSLPPAPVSMPSPDLKKEKPMKSNEPHDLGRTDTSLRVHVSLLDSLMNLAGELVLSRNQLIQALSTGDLHALKVVGQKVDLVTSELQEAIMLTRMQPIGNIFSKFPRIVRDLAKNLDKEVDLNIEGKEVELDKTIIELINDPLTHLIRNAVDHGIEKPGERQSKGKNPMGKLLLRAYHEAGQVIIEIADDGKGIDGHQLAKAAIAKGLITEEQQRVMSEKERTHLIFMPGFSTAEQVTEVSGRGVGMDVVKSNLDKLGGQVDIDSQPGAGTKIRVKLPLTLAIIPSLQVSTCGERYAIPQVNLDELLRIPAYQVKERIERVGEAEVVRLRGNLLPLLSLAEVLGLKRTFIDPKDGEEKEDRRQNIADRRSKTTPLFSPAAVSKEDQEREEELNRNRRGRSDRRYHAASAVNIVVVSAGSFKYGLIVDELHGSEEIVIKPLGSHLKHCRGYAGATILGDGRVALILDVATLAQLAGLTSLAGTERMAELNRELAETKKQDTHSLLIFRNNPDEQFAVPLYLVKRIDKIKSSAIELMTGQKVIQYEGGSLPVFALGDVINIKPLPELENLLVIVFVIGGREVGLLAAPPIDSMEISVRIDDSTLKRAGLMGSAIINSRTTLIVDIFEFMETIKPEWFKDKPRVQASAEAPASTILLAEDSSFFRNRVKKFVEEAGYKVIDAEDGLLAWNLLLKNLNDIKLVVTDIEMPNLNGFELTAKIKEDKRFHHLPVIAVTSLAGEEDMARGLQAGIDDYQIKLDKEKLIDSINRFLQN